MWEPCVLGERYLQGCSLVSRTGMCQRHICTQAVSIEDAMRRHLADIRFESEGDYGLCDDSEQECPCPFCVGDVHAGTSSSRLRGEVSGEAFAVVVSAGGGVDAGGLVVVGVGLRGEGAVHRLASEEGCACFVVRNFGDGDSRREAAETGGLRGRESRCGGRGWWWWWQRWRRECDKEDKEEKQDGHWARLRRV